MRNGIVLALAAVLCAACTTPSNIADNARALTDDAVRHSAPMEQAGPYTLIASENLMDISPINEEGHVRAIIEIPAGTSAKWEVDKDNPHQIVLEFIDNKPRVVRYLGYPANYGAIPGTALPKEYGGDGDPLDVLVLGEAAPRGSVLSVRLIGVLKMLDRGEQDDKLIAVMVDGSHFSDVESMSQLETQYSMVSDILSLWFANYKGEEGDIVIQGYGGPDQAAEILETAIASFASSDR